MPKDDEKKVAGGLRRIVRTSPAPGFDYVARAGRFWPAAGTHVEILDQEHDDPGPADGKTPDAPVRIGARTVKALEADPRISLGVNVEEDIAVRGRVAGLEAEVEALKAENADLRAQLAVGQGEVKPEGKPEGKAAKK